LSAHPESWKVQAMAGRPAVSGVISRAVINVDDMPAGKILLRNAGADIGEGLLQDIVEKARVYSDWQGPIAMRKTLPPSVARTLAEFADASVRDVLLERADFDQQTIDDIAGVMKRRLAFAGAAIPGETVDDRVLRLEKKGQLNEEAVADALGMRDREFVTLALARLARAAPDTVDGVFRMRKARPVVALCWKAGLSMRLALRLQQEMAQVPPKDLMYPRNGTDYPLTDEELRWQLEFLGFKAA
jgi:uncharacterized protein (DUF2336 family)